MKLKYIEFIFENCDRFKIDGKYIGAFIIDDIKKQICRVACNSIMEMDIAQSIIIEINKDANEEYFEFGVDNNDLKIFKFDRISSSNDITSIEFVLEEDISEPHIPKAKHYHYYTYWVGDNDYLNEVQSTLVDKDGNLYIVIEKDKKVNDYFDIEKTS